MPVYMAKIMTGQAGSDLTPWPEHNRGALSEFMARTWLSEKRRLHRSLGPKIVGDWEESMDTPTPIESRRVRIYIPS